MLINALTDFLGPDHLPPPSMKLPDESTSTVEPPDPVATLSDTPIRLHVPEACLQRALSKGVLPGDEAVKPWIKKCKSKAPQ